MFAALCSFGRMGGETPPFAVLGQDRAMLGFSECVVAGHTQPGLQRHLRLPGIAQRTLPGLKWWL